MQGSHSVHWLGTPSQHAHCICPRVVGVVYTVPPYKHFKEYIGQLAGQSCVLKLFSYKEAYHMVSRALLENTGRNEKSTSATTFFLLKLLLEGDMARLLYNI